MKLAFFILEHVQTLSIGLHII